MTNISFDNPYFLFIAIPLLALLLVPFFIVFRKKNRDKHVIASLILHLLMILCVTLAAGGLSATRIVTQTDVYVVADVSYSSQLNFDEIDGYISKVRGKLPKHSQMGVVCFGKDVIVHNPLGGAITSVSEAVVDDSGTDIYGALDYTASLFEPNVIKHVVLITDARQTVGDGESRLRETIATLKQQDIYVNAIFVDATLPSDQTEVQVNDVEYVQSTYVGQGTEAIAYIQSNTQTTAKVNIYKGEDLIKTDLVDLLVGNNDYSFTLDTSAAGTFEYALKVEAENDGFMLNNDFSFTQTIADKRKVLFITSEGTKNNVTQIFGSEEIELDFRKYDAANKKKLKVPTTIEELCQYDQFILSSINIPEQVEGYTQFIDNLNVAVSTYGKSLLTFGDLQLQAKMSGADDLTNLENILPIQYGVRDADATLYGIVIDVSRSMNNNSKMNKAKNAAKFLVDQFKPNDGIIIVSYSAAGELVMGMRTANEAGKEAAKAAIDAVTPIQGTYVAGGLERMRVEMSSINDFLNKQVVLIGDSMQASSSTAANLNAVNVASQMYDEGIRVSTLNIGNEADEGNFEGIARAGKGKWYEGFTETQLKNVLENSMVENLMGTIVEGETFVHMQLPTDEVLDGIHSFNPIKGYICSQAKGDAVIVLTVDYEMASGTIKKLPLYSYRTCGNGKVASFTSKLTGTWVTSFTDKNGEQAGMKFFKNILTTNIPSERINKPFLYTVTPSANTLVEVVPSNFYKPTSVEVTLTTPSKQTQTQILHFDGSRHFSSLETEEIGSYVLQIKYRIDGNEYETTTTFMIPYLEEYDRFAGYSAGVLYDLVDERGIVSLDGSDIDFSISKDDIETYVYSFVIPLMIACVALFVVDVCIRKLRWNDIKSLFVRTNKTSKKGDKR